MGRSQAVAQTVAQYLLEECASIRQRVKEQWRTAHEYAGGARPPGDPREILWARGQCWEILGMLELRRELMLRMGECTSGSTLLTSMAQHGHQALGQAYWDRVGGTVSAVPEAHWLWLAVNHAAERVKCEYRTFINNRDYLRNRTCPVVLATADNSFRA